MRRPQGNMAATSRALSPSQAFWRMSSHAARTAGSFFAARRVEARRTTPRGLTVTGGDAGERGPQGLARRLVVVHAQHGHVLRDGQTPMVAGGDDGGGDGVVGGEHAERARQVREPVGEARELFRRRQAGSRMDVGRDAVSVQAEDVHEVPFARPAPQFVRTRRHIRVRSQVQGEQMMRGGLCHGLLVERDRGVAGIYRIDGTVEEDGRTAGERLRRQPVVVDDAAVGTPERKQFGDLFRRGDVHVGELHRKAVPVVDRRQERVF